KTRAYHYAPWDYALYLDADTRIVGSLQAGFTALGMGWELCLALDITRTIATCTHIAAEEVRYTEQLCGTGELHQYNSGVVFFRKCDGARGLYDAWHEEWQKFQGADQMALVRAMYRVPARVWALHERWNTHRPERAEHVLHVHHRARREGAP
ncbi:MAG TPA: hypothetical protein VM537_28865, partial [Anaerolineae bacterium]|nr:hypothetical protein [Anaerolineae bacterium]